MTTETVTLTAFIEQRIVEQELRCEGLLRSADLPHTLSVRRTLGVALATCKAHRAIVELHKSWPVLVESEPTFETADSTDINAMTFRMSRQIQWQTEQQYRERFGSEPPTSPMIRALASIWSDHSDYNPAWSL